MNFKEYRKKKNLTQADVAAALGMARGSYTNLENGRREADYKTLKSLSELFGVTIDDLLDNKDVKEPATENDSKPHMNELIIYARNGKTQRREYTDEKFKQIIDMIKLLGHEDSDL